MISELLGSGAENARTAKDLAKQLNINVRDIGYLIRQERLAGVLICSNSDGYFMPVNEMEINYTISSLYKRAREVRAVAEIMKKARSENTRGEKSE